jgi:hypothetical protein
MIRVNRWEAEVGKSYFFETLRHNATGPNTIIRGKGRVTDVKDMEGSMIPTIKPLYKVAYTNGVPPVKSEGGEDIVCDLRCKLYRDTASGIKDVRDPLEYDQFRLNQQMKDIQENLTMRMRGSQEARTFGVDAFAPLKYRREIYGRAIRLPRQSASNQSASNQSASNQRASKRTKLEGGRRRTLRRNKRTRR